MNVSLLAKRYNIPIISFLVLLLFYSNPLWATPACPIITQSFQGSADGAISDASATGWTLDRSAVGGATYFAVQSHRLKAANLGGIGIWTSKVFSIGGYTGPQASVKITSEGPLASTDYVQIYYKLNGGAMVLIDQRTGNFGTLVFTSPVLTNGSSVQLIVKIFNASHNVQQPSIYYIEQYNVFQTAGPCTPGSPTLSVTASATNSGVLTCTQTSVSLSATSSTSGLSYFWKGPNNFSSNSASPSVSVAGAYSLTVTTSTAWGSTSYTVTSNTTAPAAVAASNNGPVTCSNPTITLSGTSSTTGATFRWSGPNSFNSTGPNVPATAAGSYTLTATHPTSGCTATATTTLAQNIAVPSAVSDSNTGPLTCTKTTVSLIGASTTSGATYSWTGPNSFSAAGPTATTSVPGVYTLSVTHPTSGCKATVTTTVSRDIAVPAGVTANNDGPLSCNRSSATLTGISSTGGDFNWTGPEGFSAATPTVTVSVPGNYSLTVTNPINGCTASANTFVLQNTAGPANLSINSGSGSTQLTCTNSSLTLIASTSMPGVNFSWSGPGGFSALTANAIVSTPGSYLVTATDPVGGCASSLSVEVTQNITIPAGVGTTSVPSNALLNCTQSNVVLTGSSTTPGVSYSWTGPGGFSATSAVATALTSGTYSLTVTDPSNGCFATGTATVTQDLTPPASVTATPSNQITCAQNTVTLTGNSSTPGATYNWSGPGGFTSPLRITSTTVAGSYTVTVTNPATGCTAARTITVQQNKTAPAGVSIAPPDQLNCDVSSITLTGSSGTPNVFFIWSGPDDFSDVAPTTTVSAPGDYTLTVTNPTNGCSSTAVVTVEQDLTACESTARKTVSATAVNLNDAAAAVDSPPAGFAYKVSPNPASSLAYVEFSAPESTHAQVTLYNSIGVREKLVFEGRIEAHQIYKLPVDVSRLTPGMHLCIIRVGNKVYSSKLLLARL